MERLSPKVEIINHFDSLINRIDIDIDSSLENLNDQQLLSELVDSSEYDRKNFRNLYDYFKVDFFSTFDPSKPNIDSWPESTKVTDYLKQTRMRTIEELKKAQEETIEYYKLNSKRFKSEQTNGKNLDQLRNELFSDKYYFQVNFKQSEGKIWAFNVFTFVTDFFLPQFYIDSLEKLINDEKVPFGRNAVFDEKLVLTGLLYKCFRTNLFNIPNHVIHVNKEDILNVESIGFNHEYSAVILNSPSTIDLSKLVDLYIDMIDRTGYYGYYDDVDNDAYSRESIKFSIEGLCCVKTLYWQIKTREIKDFSIKNMSSLRFLCLSITCTIDENILAPILERLPNIEELALDGNLSRFNLDSLSNLKSLSLYGTLDTKSFNFDLFKILCGQLENIQIGLSNIDKKTYINIFFGCNFPYLEKFILRHFNSKRLKKELFSRFTTLKHLHITYCEFDTIETDSFSDLKQLCWLNLSGNKIDHIEMKAFSMLKNLKTLDLSYNNLRDFQPRFIGLRKSVEFIISNNMF